jgi:purine nucleoside permease
MAAHAGFRLSQEISVRYVYVTLVLALVITTMFGIAAPSQARPRDPVVSPGRLVVRVLVLTMFTGETAPWLAKESLPLLVSVPGANAPLHCARSGLCVATIGEGKSNAAASVTAILDSAQLDLRRSYFLTAGIAGTPPSVGTLGFAAWARWLVDWDLGHHLAPSEAPHGYLPGEDVGTNVYQLNGALVDTAYRLTKNLRLADSPEAAAARGHYPGQAGRQPYVAVCDTVTDDDYWAGQEPSRTAQYITDLRTNGQGRYCTTQQEDNATATALARHGYLDRYLSLRTASDFDEPFPGQSVPDLLKTLPGYQPAVENEYLVGSTVAHYLLTH